MSETISKLRDRNKVRTYYRDLNQKTIGSRLITYCLNFPDFLRFHNRDFIPKYTNVGCNTTPPPQEEDPLEMAATVAEHGVENPLMWLERDQCAV